MFASSDVGLGFGVFLQLSITDVDSRRGFAAFPQVLPCGVHCRWPTPLLVVWDGVEQELSPHMDSCRSPLSLELPPGSYELTESTRGRCWGTRHGQSSAWPTLDVVTPWDHVTL